MKSLPGHMDEVTWASVDWGSENNQVIRAATISVEQDVLFWDVAWSQLQLPPEDQQSENAGDSAEPTQHPFWHPRRLTEGHQYRSRVAAYNATARYNQISAFTGSADGMVHSWIVDDMDHDHLHRGGSPLVGHTDQVTSLVADWHDRFVLSGSCDGTLRLWNFAGHHCEGVLVGHQGSIRTTVADWTQRKAISTSMESVHIWDLGTRQEALERSPIATLEVQGGVCEMLATFSARSAAFVSRMGSIEFWDLDHSARIYSLQGHPGTLFAVHLGEHVEASKTTESAEMGSGAREGLEWMGSLTPALAGSCASGWSRSAF